MEFPRTDRIGGVFRSGGGKTPVPNFQFSQQFFSSLFFFFFSVSYVSPSQLKNHIFFFLSFVFSVSPCQYCRVGEGRSAKTCARARNRIRVRERASLCLPFLRRRGNNDKKRRKRALCRRTRMRCNCCVTIKKYLILQA